MSDLISRQDVINELDGCDYELKDWQRWKLKTMVRDIPSAQPQRKKGEWEEIEVIPEAYDIAGVKTWASKMRCNQCGFTTFAIEGHFAQYDFCPSCGADMRGESMRLIDADELIYESIDSSDTARNEYYYGTGIVAIRKEDIDDAPTIEPQTTTWLGSYSPYQCEKCGYHVDSKTRFCPDCGRRASNYEV